MKIRMLFFCVVIFSSNVLFGASLGSIQHNPFYISSDISTDIVIVNPGKNCSNEIIIFDMVGRKVKSFKQNSYTMINYSVTWKGNNSAGRRVKSGIYIVYMIRKYQDGSEMDTDKVKFGVLR